MTKRIVVFLQHENRQIRFKKEPDQRLTICEWRDYPDLKWVSIRDTAARRYLLDRLKLSVPEMSDADFRTYLRLVNACRKAKS